MRAEASERKRMEEGEKEEKRKDTRRGIVERE